MKWYEKAVRIYRGELAKNKTMLERAVSEMDTGDLLKLLGYVTGELVERVDEDLDVCLLEADPSIYEKVNMFTLCMLKDIDEEASENIGLKPYYNDKSLWDAYMTSFADYWLYDNKS